MMSLLSTASIALVFLVGLGGECVLPISPISSAGEGDEDEGLVELVLAHHARQFHDGGGAAGIVSHTGRQG